MTVLPEAITAAKQSILDRYPKADLENSHGGVAFAWKHVQLALEAAAPLIAAAERDRICQLVAAMQATDACGLPEYDGSPAGLAGYRCGEMDTLSAVRRLLREPS